MFEVGCILIAQLVVLCGEVEIDCLKDPDAGAENFLVLKSGDIEFVSAEDTSANSGEGDEDEKGDEGGDGLQH